PPDGQTFILINNTGANTVIGQFNALPEGSEVPIPKMRSRLTYVGGDGNDVALTVFDVSPGTVRSYNGTSGSWTNASRWSPGLPVAGDTLVFPSPNQPNTFYRATNDFPVGTTFGKIRVAAPSIPFSQAGDFELRGNLIRLDRGITATNTPNSEYQCFFLLPIALNASQTFTNGRTASDTMVFTDLNLDGHELTLATSSGGATTLMGGITVTGVITGAGSGSRIIKDGPGLL